MAQYLVMLRDDGSFFGTDVSAEEIQQALQKYFAWFEKLRGNAAYVASNKLHDREGRVIRRKGEQLVTMDGPFAEKEIVGGYFIVQADSYDAVNALVADCPHYDFGGSLEVRRIEAM